MNENVKVVVEGNPLAVAAFFHHLYDGRDVLTPSEPEPVSEALPTGYVIADGTTVSLEPTAAPAEPEVSEVVEEPKKRKPRKKKESPAVVVSPEEVDNAFEGVSVEGTDVVPEKEPQPEPEQVAEEPQPEPQPEPEQVAEEPKYTREMVVAALKEYGMFLQQKGGYENSVRDILQSLMEKHGGVRKTADLPEESFKAIYDDCVSRRDPEDLLPNFPF